MNYKWQIPGKANSQVEILRYITKERNFSTDEMKRFISTLQKPHNPFLFSTMKPAVERIKLAIKNDEIICIIGDYDCDGVTSTYTLYSGLKYMGANVIYKLPHRVHNGYGLKEQLVDFANDNGATLIITVDNGITAVSAVEYAKSLNIDVIITDHHEAQEVIPDCLIINPKVNKEYPFEGLCGCGVAFKLVTALIDNFEQTDLYNHLLEILAVGTVADAMDLVDENRTFVINGLKRLQKTTNVGIKELFILAGLDGKKIDVETIGFFIGPNINATGRVDSPDIALNLLLSDDSFEANKHAKKVLALNNLRKDLQKAAMESLIINEDDKVIVSTTTNVNAGIAGIVAAKVVDTYHKPCFILHEGHHNKEILSGSGRTFGDFNIIDCVTKNKHIVEGGGGHKGACGVAIKSEKLSLFKAACNTEFEEWMKNNPNYMTPTLNCTCEVDLQNVNMRLSSNIDRLKPFGSGNPEPIFVTRNVTVKQTKIVGKNANVLQLTVEQGFASIACVAFENIKEKFLELGSPKKIDIMYSVGLNEWPVGEFKVQLNIIDIIDKSN